MFRTRERFIRHNIYDALSKQGYGITEAYDITEVAMSALKKDGVVASFLRHEIQVSPAVEVNFVWPQLKSEPEPFYLPRQRRQRRIIGGWLRGTR